MCSQHSSSNPWLLMGPNGFPQMAVTNYQSILHNIPEEQNLNIQYYLHMCTIRTQPPSHHLLYTTLLWLTRGRVSMFPRLHLFCEWHYSLGFPRWWDGCVCVRAHVHTCYMLKPLVRWCHFKWGKHLLQFLNLSCGYWQEYRVNFVIASEVMYLVLFRRQKAEQLYFTYSNYYVDFHCKKI